MNVSKDIEVVVSFPARVARRLRPFISDEETRYYLQGIHVRPMKRGARFEATNGHILGIEYSPTANAEREVIIRLPDAGVMDKILGRNEGRLSLYSTRDGYALGIAVKWLHEDAPPIFKNDALFMGCVIDGTFPDIDRVIPRDTTTPSSGVFNPQYIGVIAEAIGLKTVGFYGPGPNEPTVAFSKDKTFIAVIMPMLDDSTHGPYPEWLGLEEKAEAVAA